MIEDGQYILNLGNELKGSVESFRFNTSAELLARIEQLETAQPIDFDVIQDLGPETWLYRFLGRRRILQPHFSIEWDGAYARLVFLDDAWSEYRAIDHEQPATPSLDICTKLSGGELKPTSPDEIMSAKRAFTAIREYLAHGERPIWLNYRYVR